MVRVLVTGGAGFIGAHLVQKLIEKKYKVLIFDNLKTIGGIKYINPKCDFIKGDLLKDKDLKKIQKWRPHIIFHLAAQSGGESAYDDPKYDYLSNGYGTYKLCKLARKINIKHFIYTSSVAVYGSNIKKIINEKTKIKPDSIYGISKFSGEMFVNQILKNTNIKVTIFRIFNTYGPGENLSFLKKGMVSIYSSYVRMNKPIIVKGSINRIRDITFIDDCINILFYSLKNKKLNKNELINLSSGQSLTVKQLIKEILIASKKNMRIIQKKSTPGDSFAFHTSSKKLKKLFPNVKFTPIKVGLIKYFSWINRIPRKAKLDDYHPFKL